MDTELVRHEVARRLALAPESAAPDLAADWTQVGIAYAGAAKRLLLSLPNNHWTWTGEPDPEDESDPPFPRADLGRGHTSDLDRTVTCFEALDEAGLVSDPRPVLDWMQAELLRALSLPAPDGPPEAWELGKALRVLIQRKSDLTQPDLGVAQNRLWGLLGRDPDQGLLSNHVGDFLIRDLADPAEVVGAMIAEIGTSNGKSRRFVDGAERYFRRCRDRWAEVTKSKYSTVVDAARIASYPDVGLKGVAAWLYPMARWVEHGEGRTPGDSPALPLKRALVADIDGRLEFAVASRAKWRTTILGQVAAAASVRVKLEPGVVSDPNHAVCKALFRCSRELPRIKRPDPWVDGYVMHALGRGLRSLPGPVPFDLLFLSSAASRPPQNPVEEAPVRPLQRGLFPVFRIHVCIRDHSVRSWNDIGKCELTMGITPEQVDRCAVKNHRGNFTQNGGPLQLTASGRNFITSFRKKHADRATEIETYARRGHSGNPRPREE